MQSKQLYKANLKPAGSSLMGTSVLLVNSPMEPVDTWPPGEAGVIRDWPV